MFGECGCDVIAGYSRVARCVQGGLDVECGFGRGLDVFSFVLQVQLDCSGTRQTGDGRRSDRERRRTFAPMCAFMLLLRRLLVL